MASEQQEELETLMSIYGDKITVITQGKEYIVQLEPHLSSALQLVLKRQTVDVPQQLPSEPKSAQIAHLSPVSLYVRCPLDYPALRHPECHISAPWLDPELATVVSKKLKEKFTPGNVVVFEWICYIQEELVSELSKLQNSTPAAYDGRDSGSGPQLFVRSNSQYDDLIACDQQRAYMEFFQSAHTCDVCFKDLPGESFCEPCRGCHIVVCKSCLIQSCKSRVDSGLTTVMKCVNCDNILSDIMLNGILPTELYNRYAHLIEESQLDSIPGMVYCPRPRCNKRTVSDPKESLAVCSSCSLPFCKLCRQVYHGTGPCPALQKVMDLPSVATADASKPAKQESREVKQERQIEEYKSVLWMRCSTDVKACPKCSFPIQKNGGCNKMHCAKCNALFCWACLREIDGYGHFSLGTCELFQNQPQEAGLKDVTTPDDPQLLKDLLFSYCPRCGQMEGKETKNNWIHCRNCQFQFCHLCKEACYGLWHFNEYGCTRMTSMEQDIETFKRKT
ncbi:hypothetical protein EMCRGX_G032094 [Ephydatia muelleri]